MLHVARLARLELAQDEIERLASDLAKILDHVAQLSELSTEGVPETAHVAAERAPLRDDQRAPGLEAGQALAEAPRRVDGAFAVPAFVED